MDKVAGKRGTKRSRPTDKVVGLRSGGGSKNDSTKRNRQASQPPKRAPAQRVPKQSGHNVLFVTNLQDRSTTEDLAKKFAKFHTNCLAKLLVARRKKMGNNSSHAFISMRTREAAERAIEASLEDGGMDFDGVKLKVEWSMKVSTTAALKKAGAGWVLTQSAAKAAIASGADDADVDLAAAAQLEAYEDDGSNEFSTHQLDPWLVFVDDDTGNTYYHSNTETGEIVCERPESTAITYECNSDRTSTPAPKLKDGGGGNEADKQTVIFVKNVKDGLKTKDIAMAFSQFLAGCNGLFIERRLAASGKTGHCFVDMETPEAAAAAIEATSYSGVIIDGVKLKADWSYQDSAVLKKMSGRWIRVAPVQAATSKEITQKSGLDWCRLGPVAVVVEDEVEEDSIGEYDIDRDNDQPHHSNRNPTLFDLIAPFPRSRSPERVACAQRAQTSSPTGESSPVRFNRYEGGQGGCERGGSRGELVDRAKQTSPPPWRCNRNRSRSRSRSRSPRRHDIAVRKRSHSSSRSRSPRRHDIAVRKRSHSRSRSRSPKRCDPQRGNFDSADTARTDAKCESGGRKEVRRLYFKPTTRYTASALESRLKGASGNVIKSLQEKSGAILIATRGEGAKRNDAEEYANCPLHVLIVTSTVEQMDRAVQMIDPFLRPPPVSFYIGVDWDDSTQKYCAFMKKKGRRIELGQFHSEEHAAREYDAQAGYLGRLNFPEDSLSPLESFCFFDALSVNGCRNSRCSRSSEHIHGNLQDLRRASLRAKSNMKEFAAQVFASADIDAERCEVLGIEWEDLSPALQARNDRRNWRRGRSRSPSPSPSPQSEETESSHLPPILRRETEICDICTETLTSVYGPGTDKTGLALRCSNRKCNKVHLVPEFAELSRPNDPNPTKESKSSEASLLILSLEDASGKPTRDSMPPLPVTMASGEPAPPLTLSASESSASSSSFLSSSSYSYSTSVLSSTAMVADVEKARERAPKKAKVTKREREIISNLRCLIKYDGRLLRTTRVERLMNEIGKVRLFEGFETRNGELVAQAEAALRSLEELPDDMMEEVAPPQDQGETRAAAAAAAADGHNCDNDDDEGSNATVEQSRPPSLKEIVRKQVEERQKATEETEAAGAVAAAAREQIKERRRAKDEAAAVAAAMHLGGSSSSSSSNNNNGISNSSREVLNLNEKGMMHSQQKRDEHEDPTTSKHRGYDGVYRNNQIQKWEASMPDPKNRFYQRVVSYHDDAEDAARAYDKEARKRNRAAEAEGRKKRLELNFPDEDDEGHGGNDEDLRRSVADGAEETARREREAAVEAQHLRRRWFLAALAEATSSTSSDDSLSAGGSGGGVSSFAACIASSGGASEHRRAELLRVTGGPLASRRRELLNWVAALRAKASNTKMLNVDRENMVDMVVGYMTTSPWFKQDDHTLLKHTKFTFGSSKSGRMVRDGGGAGDTAEDRGGLSNKLFSSFWRPSRLDGAPLSIFEFEMEVLARGGGGGSSMSSLFSRDPGASVFLPLLDEQLPIETARRKEVLRVYRGVGRCLLWSLLQGQPVPSCLASRVMLPAILGYDVICGGARVGAYFGAESSACSSSLSSLSSSSDHFPTSSLPQIQAMSTPELMEAIQEAEPALERSCLLPLLDAAHFDRPVCGDDGITFGFLPDDAADEASPLLLTAGNHRAVFRAAVKYALIGRRSEAVAAMAKGFRGTGGDIASPIAGLLMRSFSHEERRRLVSGEERIEAAAFLSLLRPDFTVAREGGEGERGEGGHRVEAANYECLQRVVASSDFGSARLKGLLRFITSCDSVLSNTEIVVSFDPKLPVASFPSAHTCSSQLVLSAEREYPSDASLLEKLVTCTEHSTGFGFK